MGELRENYFNKSDGSLSLNDIYGRIVDNETEQIINTTKDILRRQAATKEMFEDEKDPERRKYLEQFALISSLNFDICIKKSIIEYLVDNVLKSDEDTKK